VQWAVVRRWQGTVDVCPRSESRAEPADWRGAIDCAATSNGEGMGTGGIAAWGQNNMYLITVVVSRSTGTRLHGFQFDPAYSPGGRYICRYICADAPAQRSGITRSAAAQARRIRMQVTM